MLSIATESFWIRCRWEGCLITNNDTGEIRRVREEEVPEMSELEKLNEEQFDDEVRKLFWRSEHYRIVRVVSD